MTRLKHKTALVTGAARGIGRGISAAFIREGATTILTDIDEAEGRKAAAELGGRFETLDVASPAAWDRLEARIGSLDILVNNAGITGLEIPGQRHDPEHVRLEDWRRVHAVNLDGTLLGCQFAIRKMKSRGQGSIINLSSRSGMVGIPAAAAYASSKAAIRNHTKTVALYCAQQGWDIRCNSLHPAAIMTPMWDPMLGEGDARQDSLDRLIAAIPQRRFGDVEEVAAVAVLLASDEARYMTGAELTLDGGILAGAAASPDRTGPSR
jgi:NAD(P)-dependent dehydrogenase (short-subunit alcohol dehydrogenase family)